MPAPHTWERGDHPLGRGFVRPGLVASSSRSVRLELDDDGRDGAEIRTSERVGFGSYTVRMRTPYAPGSLTAFFLYEDVATGNDEIDIEIFNDGSRLALLTAWMDGEQVRQDSVPLPFDPADGAHEYTIAWQAGAIDFAADGAPLAEWGGRLPRRPMKLMLNLWWPRWLEPAPLPGPRAAEVEWVRW